MMLLNKLKLPVALLGVALAATVFAVPLLAPAHSAPVPKSLAPTAGGIGVTKGGVFYLLRPDGTTTHQYDADEKWNLEWLEGPCRVCPSPTGRFPVAVLVPRKEPGAAIADAPQYELRLIRSADDTTGELVKVDGELTGELIWSRSGKRFYVSTREKEGAWEEYRVIDPVTGKASKSVVPPKHRLVGEAADGTLVTDGTRIVQGKMGRFQPLEWYLYRVSADGKTVKELPPVRHEMNPNPFDLSADGRTLLTWREGKDAESDVMYTIDIDTGKAVDVTPKALDGVRVRVIQVRWSPDGKRVGMIYSPWVAPWGADPDRTLHVCDRDGSNGADVFTWKARGDTLGEIWDAHFEWN